MTFLRIVIPISLVVEYALFYEKPLPTRVTFGQAFRNLALPLGELERATRFSAAVFLAFDHTRIAGQKATTLEHAAQVGLKIGERLCEAMPNGASLAGQATARHRADHVVLAGAVGGDQRLLD